MKACLVYITVPTKNDGKIIAKELLVKKLAACVNIIPKVESFYMWKGDLCHDEESILIVKTTQNCFDELSNLVKDKHSYENPCIIKIPIESGRQEYMKWLFENCRK